MIAARRERRDSANRVIVCSAGLILKVCCLIVASVSTQKQPPLLQHPLLQRNQGHQAAMEPGLPSVRPPTWSGRLVNQTMHWTVGLTSFCPSTDLRCGLNFVAPPRKKFLVLALNSTLWNTRPLMVRTASRWKPKLGQPLQPTMSSHICRCSVTLLEGMPTASCLNSCCNMSGPEFFQVAGRSILRICCTSCRPQTLRSRILPCRKKQSNPRAHVSRTISSIVHSTGCLPCSRTCLLNTRSTPALGLNGRVEPLKCGKPWNEALERRQDTSFRQPFCRMSWHLGHACCMLPAWNSTLTCRMNHMRLTLAKVPTLRCTALGGAEERSVHRAERTRASVLSSGLAAPLKYDERIQCCPAARVTHWPSEQDRHQAGAAIDRLSPQALCQMVLRGWCRKWGMQLGSSLRVLTKRDSSASSALSCRLLRSLKKGPATLQRRPPSEREWSQEGTKAAQPDLAEAGKQPLPGDAAVLRPQSPPTGHAKVRGPVNPTPRQWPEASRSPPITYYLRHTHEITEAILAASGSGNGPPKGATSSGSNAIAPAVAAPAQPDNMDIDNETNDGAEGARVLSIHSRYNKIADYSAPDGELEEGETGGTSAPVGTRRANTPPRHRRKRRQSQRMADELCRASESSSQRAHNARYPADLNTMD